MTPGTPRNRAARSIRGRKTRRRPGKPREYLIVPTTEGLRIPAPRERDRTHGRSRDHVSHTRTPRRCRNGEGGDAQREQRERANLRLPARSRRLGLTSGVGLGSLPRHLRASEPQCRDRVSVAAFRTPSRLVRNQSTTRFWRYRVAPPWAHQIAISPPVGGLKSIARQIREFLARGG